MTPEQERVSSILLDTVALLCKNSLSFTTELKVQGLIGITMDGSDIFLVQINELFHSEAAAGSSVKQERAEVGAHQTPNPSQTFNERRATPQKRQPAALRKPVSRPLYSQSNRSNQMAEEVEAYHLNQNIKSEVGYDDPTSSTFGEYGYAENTVMAPPTSSSKVKPISMMRQTQVTYGSGASSSTVASTIVTEAFNMLDEGEEEEEEGLGSQDDHMEQVDEMPKWDPTSGDGLYQHHLDQSQLNPVAPAAQMMWTGAMTTPRSSGFGFSHKVKHSMRGRGTPVMRGRQAMSAPSSARFKASPSDPYVINETSHLCGYPNCGKRFRFRHDLLRHQTKKHGRMPVGRGRANRVQDFPDYE